MSNDSIQSMRLVLGQPLLEAHDEDPGLVLVAPVVAELTGHCGHAYTDAAYLCLDSWGAEQKWNLHYRRLGS
jgi:hypothetical protein